jgi:hypothetical protein
MRIWALWPASSGPSRPPEKQCQTARSGRLSLKLRLSNCQSERLLRTASRRGRHSCMRTAPARGRPDRRPGADAPRVSLPKRGGPDCGPSRSQTPRRAADHDQAANTPPATARQPGMAPLPTRGRPPRPRSPSRKRQIWFPVSPRCSGSPHRQGQTAPGEGHPLTRDALPPASVRTVTQSATPTSQHYYTHSEARQPPQPQPDTKSDPVTCPVPAAARANK